MCKFTIPFPQAECSGNTGEKGEVQYDFLPFIYSVLVPQISALIILVFPLPLINSEFGLHKLKIRTIEVNASTLL